MGCDAMVPRRSIARCSGASLVRDLDQGPAQVHFAEYNHVIQAVSPDGTDEPFDVAILPRRAWCYRMVTNSHGVQPSSDGGTVRTIAIPKERMGRLIPGKSLTDLL